MTSGFSCPPGRAYARKNRHENRAASRQGNVFSRKSPESARLPAPEYTARHPTRRSFPWHQRFPRLHLQLAVTPRHLSLAAGWWPSREPAVPWWQGPRQKPSPTRPPPASWRLTGSPGSRSSMPATSPWATCGARRPLARLAGMSMVRVGTTSSWSTVWAFSVHSQLRQTPTHCWPILRSICRTSQPAGRSGPLRRRGGPAS